MKDIADLIRLLIQLLLSSPNGQKRRNLRVVKRTYRQLRREFKKEGFTEEEDKILKELKAAILEKTLNL